jgi:hypothetical protein
MRQCSGTRSRGHRAGGHTDRTSFTCCLSLISLSPSLLTLHSPLFIRLHLSLTTPLSHSRTTTRACASFLPVSVVHTPFFSSVVVVVCLRLFPFFSVVLWCQWLFSAVSGLPFVSSPSFLHYVGDSWGQRNHSLPQRAVHFCSGFFIFVSASTYPFFLVHFCAASLPPW